MEGSDNTFQLLQHFKSSDYLKAQERIHSYNINYKIRWKNGG